ncbi:MAG: hypothetical protein HY508_11390 [Acidobacteria bacterium]|nr:hypothetical protein [Acidobacteriota bacterium]
MRAVLMLLLIPSLVLAGCNRSHKAESKEAVQKTIETYLEQRKNLTLANMDLEVAEVKFEGETANAEVKFRSKQSSDFTVSVHYKLKRSGEGWQVESSTPTGGTGGSPHGEMTPAAPAPANGEMPLDSSH